MNNYFITCVLKNSKKLIQHHLDALESIQDDQLKSYLIGQCIEWCLDNDFEFGQEALIDITKHHSDMTSILVDLNEKLKSKSKSNKKVISKLEAQTLTNNLLKQ